MKATMELDDDLYRQLKASAALQGKKIKDLVAEGVRLVLQKGEAPRRVERIKLPIVHAKKPGSLRLTNELIAEFETKLDTSIEH